MRMTAMIAGMIVLGGFLTAAQDVLLIDGFEDLENWATGGQSEVRFDGVGEFVTQGNQALHIHVEIDHVNGEAVGEVKYPMGWPSVKKTYAEPIDLSPYDFLEFDVHFESATGIDPDFALNVTFKNASGQTLYAAVLTDLRHGKWSHEKLCIRDIEGVDTFSWVSFWLSESTYDDGAIIDFHIDNLRATRAVDYAPPSVTPVQHLLARSDAAILWFEGSCRKVLRAETPSFKGAPEPTVELWSARRETEAVQLVLHPTVPEGVGSVSVVLGGLTEPTGARIPNECLSWSAVGYVPDGGGPEGGYPDPLPAAAPFKADRQWNYPIWLEIRVPPDAVPGDYTGPITINVGQESYQVTLRLRVWDFTLPVKQSLRTSTTIYGPWGWTDEIKKWYGDLEYWPFLKELRPKIVRLLADYRLCPSALAHLPLAYDEKQEKVILRDTTEFERISQSYLDMGHHFDLMPVPYFFDRDAFLGAKKGTDAYLARIKDAYRISAEYLEQKGWLDDCYVYCVDECVVHKHSTKRDFALLNRVFDTIHSAHPKIRLFGAETPSPLLRGMNIWCTNVNNFNLAVLQEQHALGNEVWWYNGYRSPRPGTRIDARAVDHRSLFWMTYKYGIDGYLVWTVNRWLNNPWDTPRPAPKKPLGDHFLLYPNPDGTITPSLRLAMIRDGLEDYEYHVLLECLADRCQQQGKQELAQECRDTLARADAFILSYDNCPHIQPSFIYQSRRLLAEQIVKATASTKQP